MQSLGDLRDDAHGALHPLIHPPDKGDPPQHSRGIYETAELKEPNESQQQLAHVKIQGGSRPRDPSRSPSLAPRSTEGALPTTPVTTSSVHGKESANRKGVCRPRTSAGLLDSAGEGARHGRVGLWAPQSAARDVRPLASRSL
jgi:hypothetical protein